MTTTLYDPFFQTYAAKYLPQVDWRWFKAQGMAESSLNPDARSPTGAVGIMQIEPDTGEEIAGDLQLDAWDLLDPETSIEFGIYYMSKMYKTWTAKRTPLDRLRLEQASYNAGLGNVEHAQRLANNATGYQAIVAQLAEVTGVDNAHQTIWYVITIAKYYGELWEQTALPT